MSCGTHKNCTCQRDVLFSGYKRLFFGIQKIVLDFFGGQSGLINCNLLIDILEGQKRAPIGFSTVGDLKAPAAAGSSSKDSSKDSGNSKKQQQQKQHKQQEKQHTTRKASSKQQQKVTQTAQKATQTAQRFWKVTSGKGVGSTVGDTKSKSSTKPAAKATESSSSTNNRKKQSSRKSGTPCQTQTTCRQ